MAKIKLNETLAEDLKYTKTEKTSRPRSFKNNSWNYY